MYDPVVGHDPERFYVGVRTDKRAEVYILYEAGHWRKLDPRNDLRNHSPDGFQWGYGGSGPAQLALAILADALMNDESALALYQGFKFRVIAGLFAEVWTLTRQEVLDALKPERDVNGPDDLMTRDL